MTKVSKKATTKKTESTKKGAILDIASDLFLEHGYSGASINEMYRRTGISKETFYRYFKNKEELFLAVVDKELESYWKGLTILDNVPEEQDPGITLTKVGNELILYLFSKRILSFRRLIFSECVKHPRIGELYYNHGPERAYKALTSYFDNQRKKGARWRLPSRTLAEYFIALVLHKATLEQECRIKKRPIKSISKKIVNKITNDFIDAFLLT